MTSKNLLQEYAKSIKQLKKECSDAGISEEEFKEMYYDTLNELDRNNQNIVPNRRRFNKGYLYLIILCVIASSIALLNFKSIYSCFICNMQDYIYPGLRFIRKISIPFISLFPSLTG